MPTPPKPSKLRLARLVNGLRLLDVEVATQIPESRLSRMERGDAPVRPADIRRLAELYGVAPDELADREMRASA